MADKVMTKAMFEKESPKRFESKPTIKRVITAPEGSKWFIDTLEGKMKVSPGDRIIEGVNGEYYPCKPDVFYKSYSCVEPVSGGKELSPSLQKTLQGA